MSNWFTLGPVCIRIGSKHLAPWGYDRIRIGGFGMFSRTSSGELTLAAYHPRGCTTWHWYATLCRWPSSFRGLVHRDTRRVCQWHDYFRVSPRWAIRIGRQDYHRERR